MWFAVSRALLSSGGVTKLEYVTILCILLVALIPAARAVGNHSDDSFNAVGKACGGSSETTNPQGNEMPAADSAPPEQTAAADPEGAESGPRLRRN